jgi:hypothetical protein
MEGIFEELAQTLYHGSYTVVQKPDVTLGAPRKDFGQGFYTTTSKRQVFFRTQRAADALDFKGSYRVA